MTEDHHEQAREMDEHFATPAIPVAAIVKAERRGTMLVLSVALGLTSLMAIIAWTAYLRSNSLEHPLEITACDPATYVAPEADPESEMFLPGPSQDDCARVFSGRGNTHTAGEPVVVAGQVCNNSDETVAYQVSVDWVAVESGAGGPLKFPVIEVPISYDPGCQEPYEFSFTTPEQLLVLTNGMETGESLGQWRIVGTAVPVKSLDYEVYQWDSVGTFELLAR